MPISNSVDISEREKQGGQAGRRPFFQSYVDALSAARRVLHFGDTGGPEESRFVAKEYRTSSLEYRAVSLRRGPKRRRPLQAVNENAAETNSLVSANQMLSPALDAMMTQIQALAQKIEAAAKRVEEVSDKAEAAEQTALKMAELTALAATELAAFAATDQAKIIGFREAPRRRSYEYSPNMDA